LKTEFLIDRSFLRIQTVPDQKTIWYGRPLGFAVEELLLCPDNDMCIARLSDYDAPRIYEDGPTRDFQNIVCINQKGENLWVAELPTSGSDSYASLFLSSEFTTEDFKVDLKLKDNSLIAFSFSGFLVEIDSKSGAIIQTILVK
jgi:hypothetical protein